MIHPNAIDLEAFACGDALADIAAHLHACEACLAYVTRAKELSGNPPPALPLQRALAAKKKRAPAPWLAFAAPALAAAAAAVIFFRSGVQVNPPPAPTAETVAKAVEAPVSSPSSPSEPETRFKGGLQLAVVRARGNAQERFLDSVPVRAGDRLRVEVALDRTQAIIAAVLGDDGSYIELMTEGARDAGTHFSEQSVRIDQHPLSGVILLGAPDDVRRARATHDFSRVKTLHIAWETP
jgi:hypothetical protein